MPQSIEEMNTQQKLQLVGNLIVAIKSGVAEEFAGTDIVPQINELMDEMAGPVGEAMQQVEQAGAADQNPNQVNPGNPQPPAETAQQPTV